MILKPKQSVPSSRYGTRGETIFSLTYLSDIMITSRNINSQTTNFKSFCSGEQVSNTILTLGSSHAGTEIVIKNVFNGFPVRLKTLKIDYEINKVKEFIRNISILYYTRTWCLYYLNDGKVIQTVGGHKCTLSRFNFVHSTDMTEHFQV